MAERIHSGAVDLVRIAGVQIGIDFSWVIIFLLVFWSVTAQMTDADAGRLAVTENGHLIGLITRSGIMRFARTMQQLGEGPGQAAA